jgi:hypothetical protein
LKFIGDVKGFEVVDVYVEHNVDNPLMVSDPVVEDVSVEAECKRCKELGHNTRSCKGKRAAERSIPKGGNKVFKILV